MWKLLNSRKFAIYVLTVLLMMLVLSSFLPSHYTLTDREWEDLEYEKPFVFWMASHFSTPFLVTNPAFLIVSLFLFLSTLVCTINRVARWFRLRTYEFAKDKAFSFTREEKTQMNISSTVERVNALLSRGRWERSSEQREGATVISGQKGMTGFWGSVVFHVGLIICFFAGPVSVFTTFRGELVIPENSDIRLHEGFASHVGKDVKTLPDVTVRVHDFRAEFYKGIFEYDFRGKLTVRDASERTVYPFAVNEAVNIRGYQFSLHQYGFSPHVILEKDGEAVFDYYLNLRNPDEGDHFEITEENVRVMVMFFPDFVREGNIIGSRSRVPDNPVTMIKLYRDDTEIFKGLFEPGRSEEFDNYRISVPDYRHWINLVVVRESGIKVMIIGFCIGLIGLFARFMSNERRLEFELSPHGAVTSIAVKGYSRYYPAFLEREVLRMADMMKESRDVVL